MIFFKSVKERVITKQSLVENEPEGVPVFLTQVNTDKDGEFLNGVSSLKMNSDIIKALEGVYALNTECSLYKAVADYVYNNVCGSCQEFNDFCCWLQSRTRLLEASWVEDYAGIMDEYKDRFIRRYYPGDKFEGLLKSLDEVEDYWKSVQGHEFCVCLWSGMFTAVVCWRKVYSDKNELVKEIYLHDAFYFKAAIERELTDDYYRLWWANALSLYQMANMQNQCLIQLLEYFVVVGKLLKTSVVRESDFCEIPELPMFGKCCDYTAVAERIGSQIIWDVVDFSCELAKDRYYNALPLIDKILAKSGEVQQIKDVAVCYRIAEVVNTLAMNSNVICGYVNGWDSYLGNYIRNNSSAGAMPSFY